MPIKTPILKKTIAYTMHTNTLTIESTHKLGVKSVMSTLHLTMFHYIFCIEFPLRGLAQCTVYQFIIATLKNCEFCILDQLREF